MSAHLGRSMAANSRAGKVVEAGRWQLTSSNASMKQKEDWRWLVREILGAHPQWRTSSRKAVPPKAPGPASPAGDHEFRCLCLWETVLTHTITLALVNSEDVVSAFFGLCGEADKSPRTNKPQTKPVLCVFVSLRVLFLFLFSMGLSFIPEFIFNLIWFYNASSILHVNTKHLVYFLFESDMIGAWYRSPFVIKEKLLEIL